MGKGQQKMDLNERKLSVSEFADLVGRKPKSIYNWISQGKLDHLKIEGRVFIPVSCAQRILDESFIPARNAA